MKVTLWQQFSSNHSGSFEIVGEFKTGQEAQNAAIEIRRILFDYAVWLEDNHQEQYQRWVDTEKSIYKLPPPIEDVTRQYNFRWSERCEIDWISGKDNVENLVVVWRNNLFLHSGIRETWHLPSPFKTVLNKLGATVSEALLEYGNQKEVTVSVKCQAPTEEVAKTIEAALVEYLVREKTEWILIAPWSHFVYGKLHPKADLLQKLAAYYYEKGKIQKQIYASWKFNSETFTTRKELDERENEVNKAITHLPVFTEADHDIATEVGLLTYAYTDNPIERDNRKLLLRNVSFYDHIHTGLPALVAWLENLGCTVNYSFAEVYR